MIDTAKMNSEEYQNHMDALAHSVAKTLNGQRLEDGMTACAACIGFGMVQLPPDRRDMVRAHLDRIINAIIEKVPRHDRQ